MEIETIISKFTETERIPEDFAPLNNPATDIIIKQNYPSQLLDLLNIFRYILKTSEYSQRAFDLSQILSDKIKNHYAVWTYRKKYILQKDSMDLYEAELSMVDRYILEEPKGFQIWDHKRFCLSEILKLKKMKLSEEGFNAEIGFLNKVFGFDNKNYHAWAYRTWLISLNPDFVDSERARLEQLIETEVENNSYWSYYNHLTSFNDSLDAKEKVKRFAMKMLALNLTNEAAWNFVNSLFKDYNKDYEEYLISKMIQNVRFIEASYIFNQLRINDEAKRDHSMVRKCFKRLVEELDVMRAGYWKWLAEQSKIDLND